MPRSQALWYVAKQHAEIRPVDIPVPGEGDVLVRAFCSGISRGTERIVFEGRVPKSEHQRMRCPHQEGEFPFPVKYGYALVGNVEDGPAEMRGLTVFLLHPHQRHACVAVEAVYPLPPEVPVHRGILAANMETALNTVWDAGLMPGDHVSIVGGGVVGLLVAAIAARIPGTAVTVVDPVASRAALAARFDAAFALPDNAPVEQDVVIHASGQPEGLRLGLACAGPEAVVVEASWYGAREVRLPLGEAFHARRLSLVSSQVGSVPARRRARWPNRRRLRTALELLRDDRLDGLIEEVIQFDQAPLRLPEILSPDNTGLMTALTYS